MVPCRFEVSQRAQVGGVGVAKPRTILAMLFVKRRFEQVEEFESRFPLPKRGHDRQLTSEHVWVRALFWRQLLKGVPSLDGRTDFEERARSGYCSGRNHAGELNPSGPDSSSLQSHTGIFSVPPSTDSPRSAWVRAL
jgi:hypothetical protein